MAEQLHRLLKGMERRVGVVRTPTIEGGHVALLSFVFLAIILIISYGDEDVGGSTSIRRTSSEVLAQEQVRGRDGGAAALSCIAMDEHCMTLINGNNRRCIIVLVSIVIEFRYLRGLVPKGCILLLPLLC